MRRGDEEEEGDEEEDEEEGCMPVALIACLDGGYVFPSGQTNNRPRM